MDISKRFSLEDFLAYLFPGAVSGLGLYFLLFLTPLKDPLTSLPLDVFTGIIFLMISYIVGVILSGVSEIILSRFKGHKRTLPFQKDFNRLILLAFADIMETSELAPSQWSREHFYICRSLVYAQLPQVVPIVHRQSSLRQLRISLLPGLCIWYSVGWGWGIWSYQHLTSAAGLSLIIVSTILFLSLLIITINRARSNEWREVREVLTAFVAGYKTGVFEK